MKGAYPFRRGSWESDAARMRDSVSIGGRSAFFGSGATVFESVQLVRIRSSGTASGSGDFVEAVRIRGSRLASEREDFFESAALEPMEFVHIRGSRPTSEPRDFFETVEFVLGSRTARGLEDFAESVVFDSTEFSRIRGSDRRDFFELDSAESVRNRGGGTRSEAGDFI
jgi:hypothetical protein